MPTDDLTLVKRAQSGDPHAFRTLVERYQRKAYAVAYGMLRDREEAMDVSQEAFAKVHKYLGHFKGEASFYTWLYRITTNLCIDVVRRRAASGGEHLEFDEATAGDVEDSEVGALAARVGLNPQKAVLRRELAAKIEEALSAIPEKHRAILLLRELEGMSYEDLARTLEIPKGTVMSRLFHARAKVQKILKEYLDMDEPSSDAGES